MRCHSRRVHDEAVVARLRYVVAAHENVACRGGREDLLYNAAIVEGVGDTCSCELARLGKLTSSVKPIDFLHDMSCMVDVGDCPDAVIVELGVFAQEGTVYTETGRFKAVVNVCITCS